MGKRRKSRKTRSLHPLLSQFPILTPPHFLLGESLEWRCGGEEEGRRMASRGKRAVQPKPANAKRAGGVEDGGEEDSLTEPEND